MRDAQRMEIILHFTVQRFRDSVVISLEGDARVSGLVQQRSGSGIVV
jgi:hypothetical protein